MSFVPVDFFNSRITAGISAVVTAIPISSSAAAFLGGLLATPGAYTYLVLRDGTVAETVKVTAVAGNLLAVVRGVGQYPAAIFPANALIEFLWVTDAIDDYTTQNISAEEITIEGFGAISVTGEFPNFVVSGFDGGTTNTTNNHITNPAPEGSGLINVEVDEDGLATIGLEPPTFTGDGTVSVSGDWPEYSLSVTGLTGGIVQTIADGGSGSIAVGGTPEEVTLDLVDTIDAGTQGGLTWNGKGQLTTVDPAFNPLFGITSANGSITITVDGDRAVLVTANDATTVIKGVVELGTAADIITGSDETKAVTPKAVADVVATLQNKVDASVAHTAEAVTADYSNVVGSLLPCTIAAGQSVLVHAHIALVDSGGAALPQVGIAVFEQGTGAIIHGIEKVYSFVHGLSFVLSVPGTYQLELRTTALAGTTSVKSSSLTTVIGKT